MDKARVLVLRTAGTNCDKETCYGFELAGADVTLLHINRVTAGEVQLSNFDILALPGGFSYGDDVAAGKILASELEHKLLDQLVEFSSTGKLIIGICNGFQVLAKLGLLPALSGEMRQQVTLTWNDSRRFEDRWVYLKACSSKNIYIREGEIIYLPIAHAEGKFVCKDSDIENRLVESDQILFKYVDSEGGAGDYPINPNGSVLDIAAISDSTGRILGMMPHPERYLFGYQHPRWSREGAKDEGDGLQIFRNAIQYVKGNL